jgi:hypothetical protein
MGWDFQIMLAVRTENRDPTSGPAGQVEVGDVTERKLVNKNHRLQYWSLCKILLQVLPPAVEQNCTRVRRHS